MAGRVGKGAGALTMAAALGDEARVRRLIADGVAIDGLDRDGVSALVAAAQEGHARCVASR